MEATLHFSSQRFIEKYVCTAHRKRRRLRAGWGRGGVLEPSPAQPRDRATEPARTDRDRRQAVGSWGPPHGATGSQRGWAGQARGHTPLGQLWSEAGPQRGGQGRGRHRARSLVSTEDGGGWMASEQVPHGQTAPSPAWPPSCLSPLPPSCAVPLPRAESLGFCGHLFSQLIPAGVSVRAELGTHPGNTVQGAGCRKAALGRDLNNDPGCQADSCCRCGARERKLGPPLTWGRGACPERMS